MKKKYLLIIYLPIAYLLFFFSCSPKISFNIKTLSPKKPELFIAKIEDLRPVNERVGYKIFYISSISDKDYKKGFKGEFTDGIRDALKRQFILVKTGAESDYVLNIRVKHFYGEYSQTVKTVLWEYGSCLLLFIPRIFTDAIPYNTFAGSVKIDFDFIKNDGTVISRSIDVHVKEKVSTYNRSSSSTASMLSDAASPEFNDIIKDLLK